MNFTNINHAIAIMKRVRDRGDRLEMAYWQRTRDAHSIVVAEDFAHECGTAACFAGWVALSPEFQADGGYPRPDTGLPVIELAALGDSISPDDRETLTWDDDTRGDTISGATAIAAWLGIPETDANILTMATTCDELENSMRLYGVECTSQVKPVHVIRVLERLRETGNIWED